MKKITVYEAYDGTRFDTEVDCERYENPFTIKIGLATVISAKDNEGYYLIGPESIDKNFNEKFIELLNKAHFLNVRRDLTQQEQDYISTSLGIYIPIKEGRYRWDYNIGDWASYKDELSILLNNWQITFDDLVKMGN